MNIEHEPTPAERLRVQAEQDARRRLSAPVSRPGKYDSAKRKRVRRSGREAGCWVYIAADELERAGYGSAEAQGYYRVWGSSRGGLFVRLYKEA